MAFVGIVGARKYRDRQSVKDLVEYLPLNTTILTSSCRGVCTWAKDAALKRGIEIEIYAPDLNNIRSNFEVAERYYHRLAFAVCKNTLRQNHYYNSQLSAFQKISVCLQNRVVFTGFSLFPKPCLGPLSLVI